MMRVYISVLRNSLPPVRTVWPISEEQQSLTVAQLLENVNDIFPLEAGHWGLEDYVVTIGGYECIQHHEIGRICKDEDEVVIRPLQTAEVRARTLTGRHQISSAGRHLIDGVAFGKPALKKPVRPEVHIPPRKRRKLNAEEDTSSQVLMLECGQEADEDMEDTDQSDDSDFDADSPSHSDGSVENEENSEEATYSDEEVDSDDSDSEDGSVWSIISSDLTASSEASSKPYDGQKSGDSVIKNNNADLAQRVSASNQDLTVKETQSVIDTNIVKEKETIEHGKVGIPFAGKGQTKHRNLRRRVKKRLNYMKAHGHLPQNATFDDLAAYENNLPQNQAKAAARLQDGQQRLLAAIASGGVDIDAAEFHPKALNLQNVVQEDDEDPPEQYSTKIKHVDPSKTASLAASMDDQAVASKTTSREASVLNHQNTTVPDGSKELTTVNGGSSTAITTMIPPAVQRRSRLDLAGSQRLLFGSLGVRVPKNDVDKDKTRFKLANGSSSLQTELTTSSSNQLADEIEDWQSKINLSAIECWDEDVELSAPPFPFRQRWDPQYRQSKKRKRNGAYNGDVEDSAYQHIEQYDKYNTVSGSDALNYDDNAEDEMLDEHWEDGALLNDDIEDSFSQHDDGAPQDDFPPVPKDITTLPLHDEKDAKAGDYLVYTELVCSADTNWQPNYVTRTVQLLTKDSGTWTVKVALRDLPAPAYDDDGNRVYNKFEMEAFSDAGEEDDDTIREMSWHQFNSPRLLRP